LFTLGLRSASRPIRPNSALALLLPSSRLSLVAHELGAERALRFVLLWSGWHLQGFVCLGLASSGSLSLLFALWGGRLDGRRMGAVRGGGHHLVPALDGCTIRTVPGHHVWSSSSLVEW